MLFFINFALGVCSGEYIGARSRNATSQPARLLGVRSGEYTRAIYQRSARMGLCRKSSYARRMPSSSSVL